MSKNIDQENLSANDNNTDVTKNDYFWQKCYFRYTKKILKRYLKRFKMHMNVLWKKNLKKCITDKTDEWLDEQFAF